MIIAYFGHALAAAETRRRVYPLSEYEVNTEYALATVAKTNTRLVAAAAANQNQGTAKKRKGTRVVYSGLECGVGSIQ